MNEWQGTLECVLVGFLKPCFVFETCGLGTPSFKASRNTAENSELKVFHEHGGSPSHDRPIVRGRGWHGTSREPLGISCPQNGVLGICSWEQPAAGTAIAACSVLPYRCLLSEFVIAAACVQWHFKKSKLLRVHQVYVSLTPNVIWSAVCEQMMEALRAGRKGWVLPVGSFPQGGTVVGCSTMWGLWPWGFRDGQRPWRKCFVFRDWLALPLQDFPVLLFGFVCLQQFICSFLFKLTSPHAYSFLLLCFLVLFPFPRVLFPVWFFFPEAQQELSTIPTHIMLLFFFLKWRYILPPCFNLVNLTTCPCHSSHGPLSVAGIDFALAFPINSGKAAVFLHLLSIPSCFPIS